MTKDRVQQLADIGIQEEGAMSEARLLELNRKRFGSAPERIEIEELKGFSSRMSHDDRRRYMSFRPRAGALGLRLAQEITEPFRMVLVNDKGDEFSAKSSSIEEIDFRLFVLEDALKMVMPFLHGNDPRDENG